MIVTPTQIIAASLFITGSHFPADAFITPRHVNASNFPILPGKCHKYRNYRSSHVESHNVVNSELLGILNERSEKTTGGPSRLLEKYGLASKLSSGLFTVLPLGTRVLDRIKRLIKAEMRKLNAVELILPILQPESALEDKLKCFGSELFKLKGRDKQTFYLSPTCEDLCALVVKSAIFPLTKSTLPLAVYQINSKFRDEPRVSSQFSRNKEFLMLDAYSFHATEDCASVSYTLFTESFKNILDLLGLKFRLVEDQSDGNSSHEIRVGLGPGHLSSEFDAPEGQDDIEVAHLFRFGTAYSQRHGLEFEGRDRVREHTHMNSYGIGLNRLLAALASNHSDEDGLRLPQVVAPYDVSVISCNEQSDGPAHSLARALMKRGLAVLHDDREESVKNKMLDSRRVGIPHVLLLSDKFKKMNPNRMRWDLAEAIAKNSRISNHYNLRHSPESLFHGKDAVNVGDFSDLTVEYHPRLGSSGFIIKVRDLLDLLGIP